MLCHACKKEVSVVEKVYRGDECPHCSADLKVCLNCTFYDKSYNNQCRETSAEMVRDKEKANFCDYFKPSSSDGGSEVDSKAKALEELENLFKK